MATAQSLPPIPVLLLKTKSSPTDAYEELFAASTTRTATSHGDDQDTGFEPVFVPVLEHRFDNDGVARLRDLLAQRLIANNRAADGADRRYGGLIFTSQRAVEAFAKIVADGPDSSSTEDSSWPHLQGVPIYSVGPATTRALRAVPQQPPLQISGEHTGNGQDLAYYIQGHYASWARPGTGGEVDAEGTLLPPLLFVVGEKRRDIIPRVLLGTGADGRDGAATPAQPPPPPPPPIRVDEIVVYGTGVMPSFASDFERVLATMQDRAVRWAVVFSPTGCDSVLAALGLLDPATGRAARDTPGAASQVRSTFVATIGPTTRAYLRETFGFEPDVCADEPSPQGVLRSITKFMATREENQILYDRGAPIRDACMSN